MAARDDGHRLADVGDIQRCPHAWLFELLFRALPRGAHAGPLYCRDHRAAGGALAEGLARLRPLVSLDRDAPEGLLHELPRL